MQQHLIVFPTINTGRQADSSLSNRRKALAPDMKAVGTVITGKYPYFAESKVMEQAEYRGCGAESAPAISSKRNPNTGREIATNRVISTACGSRERRHRRWRQRW